ncbi:(2Fe-2S)-binding protein [Spongisporangium articulatum]|uniref:(2Fe-2S)-binding protein n=1 Tax=Spongisporangium articulatum TaxID=3362603 RepID=A0ABW8ATR7_9ACTN
MDLGPYFAVERHPAHAGPGPGWWSLHDLTGALLEERVEAVRAALAGLGNRAVDDVPVRVAGSVLHLGLAARLVSPVLGAATLTGVAPRLDPETWWWQPVLGGPVPVSLADGPDVPVAEAVTAVLTGPLEVLREALATRPVPGNVPSTVLRGNVASAVNGAYGQVVARRPDLEPAARAVAARFLAHPGLAGTGTGECGPEFRRRSCCLIYRLAPGGAAVRGRAAYCGDCVLR